MLKKGLRIVLILIIACFCFLNVAYGEDKAIILVTSNQDKIEKGEEIEITVKIEGKKTSAFDFSLYFDNSKWDYISKIENTNVLENRILFVWFDEKGGEGAKQGDLVTFKFRAKEDGLTSFQVEGDFYDQKGNLLRIDFKEKQVRIGKEESNLLNQEKEEGSNRQEGNANLQALRLDREGITPDFSPEIYEYYLTIPTNIQEIEVLAISENPNATIQITGNTNLQNGLNIITIQVVSLDETQSNTYTIQVTKTDDTELANINLEILAIENVLLVPPFDNSRTNYQAQITNEQNDLNVLAIPENERAIVTVTGKDNLKDGNNLLEIVVTAPNGFSKKKFQVEVYRRNEEEEKRYQEERQLQKEALEEAYEIEELSSDIEEVQEVATIEQTKKYGFIFAGIAICTVILVVIVRWIWKRKGAKK